MTKRIRHCYRRHTVNNVAKVSFNFIFVIPLNAEMRKYLLRLHTHSEFFAEVCERLI